MQSTVARTKNRVKNGTGKRRCSGRSCANDGAQTQNDRQNATSQDEYAAPLVDIIEYDDEFVILADMPGVSEEGVEVDFNDGELTIFGAVDEADDQEDVVVRACQFNPSDYFRSFRVGESIDSDAIDADFNDGVLTVTLPKRKEIQPRKIAVNSGSGKAKKLAAEQK